MVSCKALDYYIKGSKVIVRTDCNGLIESEDCLRGKLYRWKLALTKYNLQFKHINGCQNNNADWLSRSIDVADDIKIPDPLYISTDDPNKLEIDLTIPTLDNIIYAAELEIRDLPDEIVWEDGIPVHERLVYQLMINQIMNQNYIGRIKVTS